MQITKIYRVAFLLVILFSSCIDRYYLNTNEEQFEGKVVINGTITDEDGEQKITVSKSTNPEFPYFESISGCDVEVEDDAGNHFVFQEKYRAGNYVIDHLNDNMVQGRKYRLSVTMPDGEQYLSSFEELLPCPEIEDVYYDLKSKATNEEEERGLQFYLDFKGDDNYGDFYRWKLVETYEYHSSWPITRYLDYDGYHEEGTDYSYYTCYQTKELGDIFTLSTKGLIQNRYKKYPLHFVNDHTQRLMYQYSLLVKQYSLSQAAYSYWESLRKNNQESADLFGKQPASVGGNIYHVGDSIENVLGFFGVSSVTSKRIQIVGVPELSFDQVEYCEGVPLKPDERIPDKPRPLYLTLVNDGEGGTTWGYAASECFICTMLGGTTEKPPYWIE